MFESAPDNRAKAGAGDGMLKNRMNASADARMCGNRDSFRLREILNLSACGKERRCVDA
jgi:hypothetical protein